MPKKNCSGVALITALLIVALASIAAVSMAARQNIDIRRTTNVINGDQAYWFALGIESTAMQVLARDKKRGETDHLEEGWAQELPPLKIEGGQIAGHVEDLQARFNINNIIRKEDHKVNNSEFARFQHLLLTLDIAPELAGAVLDWIDADINPAELGGAEDDEYTGLEPLPYRTANTPMHSPSELQQVKGVTREMYATLAPYISTLPPGTPINVNTASAELLYAAITVAGAGEQLNLDTLNALVDGRKTRPFASLAEFEQALRRVTGLAAANAINTTGLDVKSNYFLVIADSQFGKGRAHLYSVIERDAGKIEVVARAEGVY